MISAMAKKACSSSELNRVKIPSDGTAKSYFQGDSQVSSLFKTMGFTLREQYLNCGLG